MQGQGCRHRRPHARPRLSGRGLGESDFNYRIAVIGNSGAGKSTLAKELSARLRIPHVELDALNWRPGWVDLHRTDPEQWAATVARAISGDAWITDGNYTKGAQPQILPRATDVVWLDYPRRILMHRVVRRSFARAISGRELWSGTGNRETFRRWLSREHPIRWTWDTFASGRVSREALFASDALAHARKYRLRHPREAGALLLKLTTAQEN